MNNCPICSQPRNPRETLCRACREAVGRVAEIWREQTNLQEENTGGAGSAVSAGRNSAGFLVAPIPRRQAAAPSLLEAGKRWIFRLGCKLHLWSPAETRGPSHAAQRNL